MIWHCQIQHLIIFIFFMLMKWGDEKIKVSQILAQPLHSFMILDVFLHLSGFLVPHRK